MLRIEPALPIERIDPALPMLRIDPLLPMLRTLRKLRRLPKLNALSTLAGPLKLNGPSWSADRNGVTVYNSRSA
jgi:hypothetical protein